MLIIQNMRVGIGISTAQDHIRAAQEAAEKARADIGKPPFSFAFIFSTAEFNHPLVLQTIAKLLGPITLLGASSYALLSGQGVLKHGLMIILFSLDESTYFNVAAVKEIAGKTALVAGKELGEKLLDGYKNIRRSLSVIFSDLHPEDNSNFILGFQEKLGSSFPLIGASILKNVENKKNSLYFSQEAINDAGCGILWGGKLNFGLGTRDGWQPLGKPHHITKASGNIVYEIEGEPAVNLYKEYFAKEAFELNNNIKHISIFYPLGISVSEKKEYILRSVLRINDDGSLAFQADVPQGCVARLMISSKESCLEGTAKAAEDATRNLAGKKIQFALIFNSFSRYARLGRQATQEIAIIKDILGKDVPLGGIYTSLEQAPLNSINYLGKAYCYNNSITILTIAG